MGNTLRRIHAEFMRDWWWMEVLVIDPSSINYWRARERLNYWQSRVSQCTMLV